MKTQTPILTKGSHETWQVKYKFYACQDVIKRVYPETKTAEEIIIHCSDTPPAHRDVCSIGFYAEENAHVFSQSGEQIHFGYIYMHMRAVVHELESEGSIFYFWVEVVS